MNSLGLEFQKAHIDKRYLPDKLLHHIAVDLKYNKIPHSIRNVEDEPFIKKGLINQFFRKGIILDIYPDVKNKPKLIGKGVCFDSGGYNIKNAACNIQDMWYDKNGAILAIAAAIDLKCPCSVFLVENKLDVYPGTILTEPKTGHKICIKDTDAEGRIGLADLLANSENPSHITIATLTGAASAFSGKRQFALVHNTHDLNDYVGQRDLLFQQYVIDGYYFKDLKIWPAPESEDYDEDIKSKINGATLNNIGSGKLKGGGSQIAFSFLKQFTNKPLVHVDLAAMMLDEDSNGLVWGIDEIKYLYKLLEN